MQLKRTNRDSTFRNEIRKLAGTELSDAQIDKAWFLFLTQIPFEKLHLLSELKRNTACCCYSNTNPLHIETAVAAEFSKTGKTMQDFSINAISRTKWEWWNLMWKFSKPYWPMRRKAENASFWTMGKKNIDTAAAARHSDLLGETQRENLNFYWYWLINGNSLCFGCCL